MLVEYCFIAYDVSSFLVGNVMEGGKKRISLPRPTTPRTAKDVLFETILANRILLVWIR